MEHLELLKTISGQEIRTPSDWESFRRPEIIRLLSDYIYGTRPPEASQPLSYQIDIISENYQEKNILYKTVTLSSDNFSFTVKEFLPNGKENVPLFVYIMHEFQEVRSDFEKDLNCEYVPVLDITSRGYGVIVIPTSGIYPDWEHNSNYKDGVFTLYSGKRDEYSWATISAWAWGASRVMDYIVTLDTAVDKSRVAVAGHSRGGKTALWCGATDKRFSYIISNNSGCAGAAMHRGKEGEHIKDINITDWFCANYHRFNDNEEMLPVDQHMLLAAIAPRLLYVASSKEDLWADPRAERMSCRLAGSAYALYDLEGAVLDDEENIKINTAYHKGHIGYHVKESGHSITPYDWKHFMDFADKHWKSADNNK